MTLQILAALLQDLDLDPGEEDLLDALWLARHLPAAGRPTASGAEPGQLLVEGESDLSDPPRAAATQDGAAHLPPAAPSLYPRHTRETGEVEPGGGQSAVGVRAPAAPAVGDQLKLSRALRPLTRRAPSRVHWDLDEETTARRIADEELWVPAMRPTPTRWLELAVVVDGYESMSIWRRTVDDLCRMLENLGAFRDIRFWILDQAPDFHMGASIRRRHAGSVMRSPWELIDPAGRRVILVVSDCLGPVWQSQAAQLTLDLWARRGPVAIIQPLPQRMWNYSHVRVSRARLQATQPGAANSQLDCRIATAGSKAESPPGALAPVPVPVLELDAAWLSSWSRLLTASGGSSVDAMVLLTAPPTQPALRLVPARGDKPLSPAERVRRFRATASPGALRLAEFMSVAPVTLPVIHLVQEVMLDEHSQSQVAEVLLGGLLCRVADGDDPDLVQYDFFPGVREILQHRLKTSDALRTLQKVSDYVGLRFGQARDFRALLAGVDITTGDSVINPGSIPFAQVATQVLRTLGGLHTQSAERLAHLIGEESRTGTDMRAAAALPSTAHPDLMRTPAEDLALGVPDDKFTTALEQVTISDRRSRQTPLVCPYCYHAFAERDILFRCEGYPAPGRPACKRDVDLAAQREMGKSAPLLPVFPADGRKAEAICPRCRGTSTDQVCPQCHSSLPADFAEVQGRLIALVGPSEAGKTAFMAVLVHELQRQAGALLDASITAADDLTHERFRRYCEAPLYGNSALPDHTTTGAAKYIEPFVYRFSMDKRGRFRTQSRELILSFADSAGEDLASASKIEFMARYLAAADAVIVLVDPLQFQRVRDRLRPGTPVPATVSREQDPRVAFERITSLLRASTGDGLIQKPVAIVLSKVDALWQFLPADSPLQKDKPPLAYFDATDHVAVQEQVNQLLVDWGAESVDRLVRKHYARARYFALSALGVTPDAANRIPESTIRPYRVTEPFTWLLTQFGLVRSE